jgi:hypothetical protein
VIAARFSRFTVSNIDIHEVTSGDALFVRYHTDAFIDGTTRVYAQDYVTQLIAENSKTKILREYFSVIQTARALFPNGLSDVPLAQV